MFLAQCHTSNDDTDTIEIAQEYIGLNEFRDRTELNDILGVDPVRTEWCAAFVNAILEMNDIPSLNDLSYPHPLLARSFLKWGQSIDPENIKVGDVVVFPRGNSSWKGHVGFYVGKHADSDKWVILGGNQQNTVNYRLYHPKHALDIRRWHNK